MVCQQVAGSGGAGDFLAGLVVAEICDSLRESKCLCAFMRSQAVMVPAVFFVLFHLTFVIFP